MKQVGVVVEGPSDRVFWERLLNRFSAAHGYLFKVRCLNGCSRVIQDAPKLTDIFYKSGYHSVLFILDADKASCATEIFQSFENEFLRKIREPKPADRFAHIFVAIRELESWILADEACIRALLNFPEYQAQAEVATPAGKAKLLRLCQEHGDFLVGMQDLGFARQAAGHFDPKLAGQFSPSFAYFWDRLNLRLRISQ